MTDRVILHCDCNNFYASVELLEHPELQSKPVAVAGDPEGRHGIILAKNMIAKRCGVQTAETIWQAKQKCPGLILLPPHHEKYAAMSARVNAIYADVTDQVEPFSVDESWLDVTGSQRLFGGGRTIADLLRRRIRKELGITISAGVSDNKWWAKMGSDYKKPDATTVITRENVAELLHPLPIREMLFVGRATGNELQRRGIATIGQLAALDERTLSGWFGKQGEGLYQMVHGIDDAPIRRYGENEAAKSIGNGMTYPHDLIGLDAWKSGLMPLCDSVGARLRAAKLKARTITLQVKDPNFRVISRQHTLPAPTSQTQAIFRECLAILRECWREDAPIRLLTVTATGLMDENAAVPQQLSLFDLAPPEDPRRSAIEKAVDGVRSRFGKNVIHSAVITEREE